MDQTNCSFGFATDQVFRFDTFGTCNVPLLAFDASFSILLCIRFITLIFVWNQWINIRARWVKTQKTSTSDVANRLAWERRLPIVPTISALILMLWIIFVILIRLNAVSALDGVPFFFWCLGFFFFGIYSQLHQRKMIHLARRISPLLAKDEQWSFLEKFDFVLKIFGLIEILLLFSQTLCGVLALVFPSDYLIQVIAFSLQGIYMFFLVSSIGYQLYRVARVLKESSITKQDRDLAKKKMDLQNMYFLSIGYIGAIINSLIAVSIFPATWGLLIYWFIIEALVSSHAVIETISYYLRKRNAMRRPPSKKKSIVENQAAVTTNQASVNFD